MEFNGINPKFSRSESVTSTGNVLQPQTVRQTPMEARVYYRMHEFLNASFSPEENTNPVLPNDDSGGKARKIKRLRVQTSKDQKVPFCFFLIEIVKKIWFQAQRLFHDFWY